MKLFKDKEYPRNFPIKQIPATKPNEYQLEQIKENSVCSFISELTHLTTPNGPTENCRLKATARLPLTQKIG